MKPLQEQMRESYNYMKTCMDEGQMEAFMQEFTPEERIDFNTMNIALDEVKLNKLIKKINESNLELKLEAQTARELALLGIGASMTALAFIATGFFMHAQELEDEKRLPIKREILKHIGNFGKYTPDLTVAEYDQKFVNTMTDLGYANKKWQRRFINKHYGKKVF